MRSQSVPVGGATPKGLGESQSVPVGGATPKGLGESPGIPIKSTQSALIIPGMSYCLNTNCENPQNPPGAKYCESCGTTLLLGDRYRAIKQIGQGGFGRTFLAVDEYKPSKPYCVIKQFFPQDASFPKAKPLFQQEAVLQESLGKHPQIPDLLAHFEQDDRLYLVQEFIDGQNLGEELIKNGCFSEAQIWALLNDLLPVLQFIHEGHLIHRDIKPENIIRRQADSKLFLVDFGASKTTNSSVAKTGTMIGTLGYVAPEQLEGNAVFASDLYSLGLTCVHLMTGIHPFRLLTVGINTWRNHLSNPISSQLSRVIHKLLLPDTLHRYQSAAEVQLETNYFTSLHPAAIGSPLALPIPSANNSALIVSKIGAADYRSISQAIKNAQQGSRILVRPGFYQESLVIDKPLEIVGDGSVADIIVESKGSSCIRMQTGYAVVRGLTLRHRAGNFTSLFDKSSYAVDIPQGQLILENCDINSAVATGIKIHGASADPRIRGCRIHNGKGCGVLVSKNGRGTLEGCDIFGNNFEVQITEGGNPILRRCQIHNGKGFGVWIDENSKGTVEDCDIFGNIEVGVYIGDGSNGIIQRCRINRNEGHAVCVSVNGTGTVENCDLTGNIVGAWNIATGGLLYYQGNKE
ncbi:serine/threonine protein kinase [Crinalium epipsammum PCC 9333]|uniref:non-specific serine/threonine protein kinase n=1 Tax=Crinalium epipsammum PCC 9333 TaxID=1173022 RepID=K9W396_9CYAN|nr:right-handed parallel beta-helix repeat-containing protein [Crinalium epipsammum]AFZ14671.1 serine/threonine protein kinase [Crinalium epipsammum PCC 9333]